MYFGRNDSLCCSRNAGGAAVKITKSGGQGLLSGCVSQVDPVRVDRLYECDFLLASPPLYLFLSFNRDSCRWRRLCVDEPSDVVFRCELRTGSVAVLTQTGIEIRGDSDVERAPMAREDVDVEDHGHMIARSYDDLPPIVAFCIPTGATPSFRPERRNLRFSC